jgi:membrane-associated phospholipid phosphatase
MKEQTGPGSKKFPVVLNSPRLNRLWTRWKRPLLLFSLLGALALFLLLLPPGARRSLLFSILRQRTLIILLLTFSVLFLSLLWTAGERLDAWMFLIINVRGWHPPWLDRAMWWLTQLGNGLVALVGAAFIYLVGYHRVGIEMILGTLSLWLTVETFKALTDRARPFILLEDVRVVGWREPGLSFPSGHTSQVFFLVSFLSRSFQITPEIIFLLYFLAVMVALTRMYVGAHYPRDVLAGALLGSVWGALIMLVDQFFVNSGG